MRRPLFATVTGSGHELSQTAGYGDYSSNYFRVDPISQSDELWPTGNARTQDEGLLVQRTEPAEVSAPTHVDDIERLGPLRRGERRPRSLSFSIQKQEDAVSKAAVEARATMSCPEDIANGDASKTHQCAKRIVQKIGNVSETSFHLSKKR